VWTEIEIITGNHALFEFVVNKNVDIEFSSQDAFL
jgi:hypothetical protein